VRQAIWKYTISPGLSKLTIPVGAQFLSVQMQHDHPQVWMLVDPAKPQETVKFMLQPTGVEWDSDDYDDFLSYRGTFQLERGAMVFHLFQLISTRVDAEKGAAP
jgi:hypothetical protein